MKDQGLPPPAFVAPPVFDHTAPISPPPFVANTNAAKALRDQVVVGVGTLVASAPLPTSSQKTAPSKTSAGPRSVKSLIRGFQLPSNNY